MGVEKLFSMSPLIVWCGLVLNPKSVFRGSLASFLLNDIEGSFPFVLAQDTTALNSPLEIKIMTYTRAEAVLICTTAPGGTANVTRPIWTASTWVDTTHPMPTVSTGTPGGNTTTRWRLHKWKSGLLASLFNFTLNMQFVTESNFNSLSVWSLLREQKVFRELLLLLLLFLIQLKRKVDISCAIMQLVWVIEPLRVQYGINLHECVLKRIKIAWAG